MTLFFSTEHSKSLKDKLFSRKIFGLLVRKTLFRFKNSNKNNAHSTLVLLGTMSITHSISCSLCFVFMPKLGPKDKVKGNCSN